MIMIMVIDIPIDGNVKDIRLWFQFKFQDVRSKFSCGKNTDYCQHNRLAGVPMIILKHTVWTACAVPGIEHFT